jgi:hypothetical protein
VAPGTASPRGHLCPSHTHRWPWRHKEAASSSPCLHRPWTRVLDLVAEAPSFKLAGSSPSSATHRPVRHPKGRGLDRYTGQQGSPTPTSILESARMISGRVVLAGESGIVSPWASLTPTTEYSGAWLVSCGQCSPAPGSTATFFFLCAFFVPPIFCYFIIFMFTDMRIHCLGHLPPFPSSPQTPVATS